MAFSYLTMRNAIRTRFNTEVEDAHPVAVAYENANYTPVQGTPFVEFTIGDADTQMIANGSGENTYRAFADAKALIHVPVGEGDKEALEIADTIVAAMGHVAAAGITYRSPFLRIDDVENGWYVVELRIPLYYDGSEVRPSGIATASATTKENIGNIIREQFNTKITVALSASTAWDNAVFSPPDPATTWTRFSIQESEASTIEGGGTSHRYRTVGAAVAQIFSPLGIGERAAVTLADSVAGVFRATTIDGILFHTPRIRTLGRLTDRWWQLNVLCPFTYDHVTA